MLLLIDHPSPVFKMHEIVIMNLEPHLSLDERSQRMILGQNTIRDVGDSQD